MERDALRDGTPFDDYTQLADILYKMGWSSPCDAQWDHLRDWCEEMKQRWYAALRSGDGWTRVEDGFPECGEVKSEAMGWEVYRPAQIRKIEITYAHPSWWQLDPAWTDRITHWRPLPAPPEEDNVVCDFCNGQGGGYVCLGHCDEHGKHAPKDPA